MTRPHDKLWRLGALLGLLFAAGGSVAGEFVARCYDEPIAGVIEAETLAVGTLNISHGRATSLNQMLVSKKRTLENLDAIASLIDNAALDIVALQEADAFARWSGNFDHVEHLVDASDFRCATHGRHARSWLYSYGTALLSRYRPASSESVAFEPTPPTAGKGFVRDDYRWLSGDRETALSVVSVHLDFSRKSVREEQVRQLIAALRDVDGELILMGDINSDWSDRQSHVRQLAEGLRLRAFEPESVDLGTYKSAGGSRFDWILISSGLDFADHRTLPDVVSDHLLVRADIRLAPENR